MKKNDNLIVDFGVAYKDTSNPLYYIPRGVSLHTDRFITYHEDNTSDRKVWKLYADTVLEPDSFTKLLQQHKLERPAKTSTLRAVLSGRGKDIDLVGGIQHILHYNLALHAIVAYICQQA
jgi:hypothetical protein